MLSMSNRALSTQVSIASIRDEDTNSVHTFIAPITNTRLTKAWRLIIAKNVHNIPVRK